MLHFLTAAHTEGAIAVIGGADGPTAVFVTGNPVPFVAAVALCVVALAGLVYWLVKKFTGRKK